MRPRLCAIGHKVNSLLFEPSLSACETWLLPHAWTLHTLRYNQDDHGESKDQGQAWKRRRKKGEEEDGAAVGARPDIRTAVRIIRAQPDHPDPPPDRPGNCAEDTQRLLPKPDRPGLHPDRPGLHPNHPDPRRLDHPGPRPDHPALPARMTWDEARVPLRPSRPPSWLSTINRPPPPPFEG